MRSSWKPGLPFFFDVFRFPFSRSSFSGLSSDSPHPACFRRSLIPSFLAGARIRVYNGARFLLARVRPIMVNRYVGEFFFTKKIGASIHIPKKKKRKKSSK